MIAWRYGKEGDISLFSFWDFYLFELTFLSHTYDFLTKNLKPKCVSDFGFSNQFRKWQKPKIRKVKEWDIFFKLF